MKTSSVFSSCDEQNTLAHEHALTTKGYKCIAGIDEVGRGPLAGPVVAACVVLPSECDASPFIDSKKTSEKQRLRLVQILQQYHTPCGIGIISQRGIDQFNILQASLLAMRLAVFHLSLLLHTEPDFLLVDGKFTIPMSLPQLPLIHGESKSASIAAASIVAKVHRDTLMQRIDRRYPQYGFKKHKGYPTQQHRQALARFGPCPLHRLSFKGVAEFV